MDEEIDEDLAFGSEDEELYGDILDSMMHREKEEEEPLDSDEVGDNVTFLSDLLKETNDSFPVAAKDGAKLSLDDFVDSLDSSFSASKEVKQQLRKLDELSKTVNEPAPKAVSEKARRKVGYEKSVRSVTAWQPLSNAYKHAAQVKFPLNAPAKRSVTTASMTADFKPKQGMEAEVYAALEAAGVTDKALAEAEVSELEMNKLSKEEIRKRRGQLAKMRAHLLYEQIKAARTAKIKSKAFHRVRKKQAKRRAQKEMDALEITNPALAKEIAEQDALDRAKERMTMKHRNKGKWVKQVLRLKGNATSEDKNAINEQMRIHKELMARGTLDSDEEEEDRLDDGGANAVHEAEEHLRLIEQDIQHANETGGAPMDSATRALQQSHSGLLQMGFMQKAMAREREAAREDAMTALKELRELQRQADKFEEEENGEGHEETPIVVVGAEKDKEAAKRTFAAVRAANSARLLGAGDKLSVSAPITVPSDSSLMPPPAVVAKTVSEADRPVMRPVVKNIAVEEEDEAPVDTRVVQAGVLDVAQVMSELKSAKPGSTAADTQQKQLVHRAFADASMQEEFEAAKELAVEQEEMDGGKGRKRSDKSVEGLAGWGSWTGLGAVAPRPRKKPRIEKKPEVESTRRDKHMAHVVISEKRDKKLAKHKFQSVPYPFKSREQYEASIRQPLGPDWNTPSALKEMTKPEIVVRKGTVIAPLSRGKRASKKRKRKE